MARRLWANLLSDSVAAHAARLLAIILGFVGFYGLADFKAWFDGAFGTSLISKATVVLGIHFAVSWLISVRHNALVTSPALEAANQRLGAVETELGEAKRGMRASSPEASFIEGITRYVRALSDKHCDQHVLRLRDALSRHLWVEGLLRARIALGEAAEQSAARLGVEEKQVAALVDDLGWTLVATNDLKTAAEKIDLGLRIAERSEFPYWVAKAHRHLAGIATINRNFVEATKQLEASEAAAAEIEDEKERSEMMAGIRYAQATAFMFEGRFQDALKMIDASAQVRRGVGDPTRTVRSYALKGKILFRIGDPTSRGEAKATFLRGLQEAENVGRRDEIVRNLNGLATVADSEKQPKAAREYRARAKQLMEETPVPYELQDQA